MVHSAVWVVSLSPPGFLRAYLVWLDSLVPGLYEVIQYTLSLHSLHPLLLVFPFSPIVVIKNVPFSLSLCTCLSLPGPLLGER